MARTGGRRLVSGDNPNQPRRRRRGVLARATGIILTVILVTGLLSGFPASASPTIGTVNLQNLVTGLCADLPDTGPGQPDAPVTQYACRYGKDNQRWHLEPHGTIGGRQAYLIKNGLGGCMDLPFYGAQKPGTPISLYGCRPQNDNQLFVALPTKLPGVYKFAHALDQNVCLDVAGYATGGNDARLTLWTCSDNDDHLWLLRHSETDRTGASFGVVATKGAALTLRAEPRGDSSRRGALANHTPFQIQCVAGTPRDQWYRTASGRYISANYVKRRGPDVPTCGGGPATDMLSALNEVHTYLALKDWWSILGQGRQHEPAYIEGRARKLRQIAHQRALHAAGINEQQWRPEEGLDHNNDIAHHVYEYYGHLYQQKPELRWAGMAKLAGATIIAGLVDARRLEQARVIKGSGDTVRKLLVMEKDIFNDMAWQHQLYVDEGIGGIRAAFQGDTSSFDSAGDIANVIDADPGMLAAWEDVASGDQGRVNRAVRVFLGREQHAVLQHHFDDILREHPDWSGLTSKYSKSPVPGVINFNQVKGVTGCTPRHQFCFSNLTHREKKLSAHGRVQQPDIAIWEDRQIWLYQNMVPGFMAWLQDNPQQASYEIARPVGDRADGFRMTGPHGITRFRGL